jgi:diadenosine tetraphosphate (Ap4A) HIT family hydrolase
MSDSTSNILLIESEFWKAELMSNQSQLGRSIVLLNRPCADLSSLNNNEMLDFLSIVKKFESSVNTSFNATYLNWYVAMNGAFKSKPYNPQVHWHVKPRYETPITINDEVFEDKLFGEHYDYRDQRIVNEDTLKLIANKIKSNL